jgi:thiamine-monophosphate kinase
MGRARAARAAIDVSDGLADALRQVAAAGGTGVRIDAEALPIEAGARTWWDAHGVDAVMAAIAGSDDYELLFAVSRRQAGAMRSVRRHVNEPALTKIGELTKDPRELVLVRNGKTEALPEGFEHFVANR